MAVNKQRLVKTGLWQVSNTAVVILSQIIGNAVIVRYVSPKEFGIMAITNTFINFASFISEAGMGDALMQRREADLEPQHKNAALYFSFLFSCLLYMGLYFAAPYIASFYPDATVSNEPVLVPALRVLGFSFILLALGSSSLNLLMKRFNFKTIFFSDSLTLLLSNVLGVILAMQGWGVWSLVYSILFYNVARLIMVWFFEPIPIFLGAQLRHWRDLFGYGVGLTLVRFYNFVSGFGIILLIGKLVGTEQTGVYDRSYRITNIPVRYLGDMIQKILMPFMVKINDEEEKLYAFFYRGMALSNALLVPISVFAIVFCQPIVAILLGPKWESAVLPMQVLFLSLPFRITTKVADVLMRAKNLVFKNANRKLQYIIVLCIGIVLLSKWGVVGITAAVTGAAVFNYVFMLITVKNHVFKKGWKKLIVNPFRDGAVIALITVPASWGIYWLLNQFIEKEWVSFTVLCGLLGIFVSYAFLKKPKLLGPEFAELQKQLFKLVKNRGKGGGRGKGKRRRQQSGEGQAEITDIADVKHVTE